MSRIVSEAMAPLPAGDAGIRFSIKATEPLIVLQARVNGAGPFNFALDTGASLTVISPAVARQARVDLSGAKAKALGASGHLPATIAWLKSLTIAHVEAGRLRVAVMSLGTLNRATRLRLGGILGYNALRRYRVTIDYPAKRLFLESSRR